VIFNIYRAIWQSLPVETYGTADFPRRLISSGLSSSGLKFYSELGISEDFSEN